MLCYMYDMGWHDGINEKSMTWLKRLWYYIFSLKFFIVYFVNGIVVKRLIAHKCLWEPNYKVHNTKESLWWMDFLYGSYHGKWYMEF